jgi:hypothetical protein
MNSITLSGRPLFKHGTYYGPFFIGRAEKIGPFQKIFGFLSPLSFAHRRDRKIGIVVVDTDFFHSNISKDKYATLFDDDVYVN